MMARSRRKLIFYLSFFLILTSRLLLAGEEQEHGSTGLFIGQVLNFVVLFGGLAYVLRKPLQDYLRRKSAEIADLLQRSEREKNEARKRLGQTKERLQRLTDEIQKMKEDTRNAALKERERLLREADTEVERLKRLASEEIDSMLQASRRELKAYAIELSVVLAENKIKEKMTPELHRKIIDRAIENLRNLHESSIAG